jgi:hypothetical protein
MNMNTEITSTTQVGGTHYKSGFQHWDWVLATGQGYFEGQATKYITRWRKKGNGACDLRKGLTYINKLLEWVRKGHDRLDMPMRQLAEIELQTAVFARQNNLTWQEQQVLTKVASWQKAEDLEAARELVVTMIEVEDMKEPRLPIKDPDPVPLTEENKYSPRVGQEEDDED